METKGQSVKKITESKARQKEALHCSRVVTTPPGAVILLVEVPRHLERVHVGGTNTLKQERLALMPPRRCVPPSKYLRSSPHGTYPCPIMGTLAA
jgi:hypothetical protein